MISMRGRCHECDVMSTCLVTHPFQHYTVEVWWKSELVSGEHFWIFDLNGNTVIIIIIKEKKKNMTPSNSHLTLRRVKSK